MGVWPYVNWTRLISAAGQAALARVSKYSEYLMLAVFSLAPTGFGSSCLWCPPPPSPAPPPPPPLPPAIETILPIAGAAAVAGLIIAIISLVEAWKWRGFQARTNAAAAAVDTTNARSSETPPVEVRPHLKLGITSLAAMEFLIDDLELPLDETPHGEDKKFDNWVVRQLVSIQRPAASRFATSCPQPASPF